MVAVLTRPDAASGRRGRPAPSPVAQVALDNGIPVLRPARPNTAEFVAELAELAPDCCAVVAYGALLGDGLLAVPGQRLGEPAFLTAAGLAGCSPGAGGHRGRRLGHRRDDVPDRTAVSTRDRCTAWSPRRSAPPTPQAIFSGGCRCRVRRCWSPLSTASPTESLTAVPQPSDGVTVAPKITVDEARIRWDLPAHVVERRIRAVTPNPGAWTMIGDLRYKLGPVTVDTDAPEALEPGEIRCRLATGSASVPAPRRCCSSRIQPPGKKPMNAADWARGARLADGERAR